MTHQATPQPHDPLMDEISILSLGIISCLFTTWEGPLAVSLFHPPLLLSYGRLGHCGLLRVSFGIGARINVDPMRLSPNNYVHDKCQAHYCGSQT